MKGFLKRHGDDILNWLFVIILLITVWNVVGGLYFVIHCVLVYGFTKLGYAGIGLVWIYFYGEFTERVLDTIDKM